MVSHLESLFPGLRGSGYVKKRLGEELAELDSEIDPTKVQAVDLARGDKLRVMGFELQAVVGKDGAVKADFQRVEPERSVGNLGLLDWFLLLSKTEIARPSVVKKVEDFPLRYSQLQNTPFSATVEAKANEIPPFEMKGKYKGAKGPAKRAKKG